mgnify:CR=1 FL=1
MKTLRFEGYSDDTFGEYAITNEDYDNCANGKPIVFRVRAEGRSLLVIGHYAPEPIPTGAGWIVGVSPDESDDEVIPSWPMRIAPGVTTRYSPALYIDVPDDFAIEHIDCEAYAAARAERQRKADAARKEDLERAQFERLRTKFGGA